MGAFGIKAIQPQDNTHILGFATARDTTDESLLEIWNGPNSGTLVCTIDKDGQVQVASGSASRPSYSFEADKDSGRYMSAAGTFLDVIAGTAVGTWTAGKLALAGDLEVGDDVTLKSDAAVLNFGADSDVSLTHVADTGLLLNSTRQLQFNDSSQYISGTSATVLSIAATDEIDLTATAIDLNGTLDVSSTLTVAGAVDFNGALDVDGTTNLDAVDIDGAVQIDSTVTVGVDDTGYDVKFFGDTASAYMLWDTSTDDLVLAGAAGIDLAGDLDVDGTANLDVVDIDGAVDMASTLTLAGNADFNGDLDVDGTSNLDVVDIDGAVDMASTLLVSGAITGASTIQGTTITATTAFVPDASDGAALGTTSLEFSDLYLADGAVIGLGDDQDVSLTHVADTGLLLNSTMALQFNDASQYINAPSATVLDINATDEIELNATAVDLNGTLDVSGTSLLTGNVTMSADASVGDDLSLVSDAAVLNFGGDSEVSLTHVHDTGLLLNSTRRIQFNDASQYIGASSAADLDIAATTDVNIDATTLDVNAALTVSGTSALTGNVTIAGDLTVNGTTTTINSTTISVDDKNIELGSVASPSDSTADGGGITLKGASDKTILWENDTDSWDFNQHVSLKTDAAVLAWGADRDVTLTHVADTGILLNSTRQLQFNDASQYISGASATKMIIAATDEVEINTTAVDLNGTLDVSGTLTLAGNADFNGDLDVDGTTNLDVVDIDGAVDMASTLGVSGATTLAAATLSGNLEVAKSAAKVIVDSSSAASVDIDRSASDQNATVDFQTAGSSNWAIGLRDSDDWGDGTSFMMGTGSSAANTKFALNTSGVLTLGTVTPDAFYGATARLQVEGTGGPGSSISAFRNSNDANGPALYLGKSRGTAVNSDTIVQDDDHLGAIYWDAADGTDRGSVGAEISCFIDGTPGANDVPSRLQFGTTADGANAPTYRMTILSDGKIGIGTPTPTVTLDIAGTPTVNISNTGANANGGVLNLKNTRVGQDDDEGGRIYFYTEDDAGNGLECGLIRSIMTDASNTSEDSKLLLYTYENGSQYASLQLEGRNVTMNPLGKFYLDGGGNTYIHERGADHIGVICGGSEVANFNYNSGNEYIEAAQDFVMPAGGKFYLDGRSNTYIEEGTADRLDVVAGGVTAFHVAESGSAPHGIEVKSYGNLAIAGITEQTGSYTSQATSDNEACVTLGTTMTGHANNTGHLTGLYVNNSFVVPASTTVGLIAQMRINTPGINLDATSAAVTNTASFYIEGAPSGGGTNNYAGLIDSGAFCIDVNLLVGARTAGANGYGASSAAYIRTSTSTFNALTLDHNVSVPSGTPSLLMTTAAGSAAQSYYHIRCVTDRDDSDATVFQVMEDGNVTLAGALSKGSGSFKIDHPLPEKKDTHSLYHSFIEGPRADLNYRGKVELSGGTAQVDLDEASDMSEGTWELLCRDPQCWVQNEDGWSAVRGSVEGSVLTIECADSDSSDSVSWLVVAERCDEHMMETDWTDETGKVIVEQEKVAEPPIHGPSPEVDVSP